MGIIRRAAGASAAAALALSVAAGAAVAVVAGAPTAGALRSGVKVVAPAYYVAVGASEAVGYQPMPGRRRGSPSRDGYAEDLARIEGRRWPGLALIELGCPGITAPAALTGSGPGLPGVTSAGGPARCTYPQGSEVATAVQLIRRRAGRTMLVTVDLGFNDVWPCLRHGQVDQVCVAAGLRQVRATLPVILSRLRAAGGRRMLIVGLQHSDPYLADSLRGRTAFALASETVIDQLNNELAAIYTTAGALVADVPSTYATDGTARVRLPGYGAVPQGVARACTLTWMCTPQHNLHPNDAGYRAIADAVAAAISAAPMLGA